MRAAVLKKSLAILVAFMLSLIIFMGYAATPVLTQDMTHADHSDHGSGRLAACQSLCAPAAIIEASEQQPNAEVLQRRLRAPGNQPYYTLFNPPIVSHRPAGQNIYRQAVFVPPDIFKSNQNYRL